VGEKSQKYFVQTKYFYLPIGQLTNPTIKLVVSIKYKIQDKIIDQLK